MRIFNWAKIFEESPTCEDVLKRVRKTEIAYWIYMVILIIFTLGGLSLITEAGDNEFKAMVWGLFIAITGVIQIALIKIWAHIRLTTYWLIWDRNNKLEAELKQSQAMDL